MSSAVLRLRQSLGFSIQEVAARGGWSAARQHQLETSLDDVEFDEALALGELLGVGSDALMDDSTPTHPLAALLKGDAAELSGEVRFALASAASVAREIQELRERLGRPFGLVRVGEFRSNGDYGHPERGLPQRLARAVRRKLNLEGVEAFSMQRDVLEPLGVVVLWLPLPERIDAVAMASEATGAVIVANPRGAHMRTAPQRRITLAHELCHLLFDRPEMYRFAKACVVESGAAQGQEQDWFYKVERRARAFAPALLAPEPALRAVWEEPTLTSLEARLEAVMSRFGLSLSAAYFHSYNMGLCDVPDFVSLGSVTECVRWEELEPMPLPPGEGGSWLRSGELRVLCEEALERGLVSRRWVAERLVGSLAPPSAWSPQRGDGVGYSTSSSGAAR